MIIWMMWSVLITALVALAASASERVATHYRLARRFIWLTAIALTALAPFVVAVLPTRAVPSVHSDIRDAGEHVAAVDSAGARVTFTQVGFFTPPVPRSADMWAIRIWILMSLGLAGTILHAMAALRRRRGEWKDVDLGQCRALVTTDIGPAVLGFVRPQIVVPEWVVAADESTRGMILRHEIEHLRARDPQMLLAAGLALIALPWNVALWWLVGRLRSAMELDCDARVVRDIGHSYEYGRVLLAVGERHTLSLPLTASLAGRRPLLERRIKAMTTKSPRWPSIASLPFAALALIAMTAAGRLPHPSPVSLMHATTPSGPFPTREEIAGMLRANVPTLATAGDSSDYAVLVLDANNDFMMATAGYGDLIVQVLGDTLDDAARERRTVERMQLLQEPGDSAAMAGGRARRGGAGSAIASAGGGARRGGSGAGGGSVYVVADTMAIAGERPIPPGAVRRGQWQGKLMGFALRDRDTVLTLGGGAHGYVAGLTFEHGPDRDTGIQSTSPVNAAAGLHALPSGVADDSGIEGIPASSLTSVQLVELRGELRRNVTVMVVTTNLASRR